MNAEGKQHSYKMSDKMPQSPLSSIPSLDNRMSHTDEAFENLTNVAYWDKDRQQNFVPWDVNGSIFSHILDRHLPVNHNFTCTEIGAYPGSFLCHMAKAYGYRATAIEFSNHTEHIRKLFSHNQIPVEIINDDFLNVTGIQFDVVSSFGFVEHFKDYEKIIAKHFELARPGGYVIISVPRFDAFQGRMFETVYDDEAYRKMKAAHNLTITNLDELKRVVLQHTDEILFADHVVGDLLYYNWKDKNVKSDMKWLVYFINKIQPLVSNAIELDDFMSPYILTISRKPFANVQTPPVQVLHYLQNAAQALSSNNINEAVNYLTACTKQFPKQLDSYGILCELYLTCDDASNAVHTALCALKANGFSYAAINSVLEVLKTKGGLHLLDELYLRAAVWEPENPETRSYIKQRQLTVSELDR